MTMWKWIDNFSSPLNVAQALLVEGEFSTCVYPIMIEKFELYREHLILHNSNFYRKKV